MEIDPATLVATRQALHAVAEHVLMAELHHHAGRIGLRAAPGGFATPLFPTAAGIERLRVDGTQAVRERDGKEVARAPLSTLGAVRRSLGVEVAAPTTVYPLVTEPDDETVLAVDLGAARLIAAVFAATDTALASLRAEAAAEDRPRPPGRRRRDDGSISRAQLWPEHLDLALTIDEVNYGGSPGDAEHDAPYLYVGPWARPLPEGGPWNEPFGASLPADPPPTGIGALAWFRQVRAGLG